MAAEFTKNLGEKKEGRALIPLFQFSLILRIFVSDNYR